ncbi:MAG: ABC transporter permease [Acidimicrobiales bacterium]|nr:ABC transporter permease [Acidimicrobiales bacterium]
MTHLQYLLLGLGGGAVLAALALGLVLGYRASGVVNFAHAAMGMFLAYSYASLRQAGELLNPLPFGPDQIKLLPTDPNALYRFAPATAFALTMVLALVYGLAVYWLVFRPLRNAPTLARVVSSLGLFLYLLAISKMRIGTQGATVAKPESLLPTSVVDVGGVSLPQDRLWLTALVVGTAAVLAAVYRYTRFGLATRAAAESEKGAVLLGLSPDLLASVNWIVATMLAGAAVILIAPIAGLNPTTTSLLIVPAMAAALLGRFSSFTVTVAAGLGIGMVQSELLSLQTDWTWLPDVSLGQVVPFVVIIATMALRGESLPTRATLHEGRFPRSPHPRRVLTWSIVLAGGALVGMLTLPSNWRSGIIVTATMALIALSVVMLTGYVGQISLMPMAMAGIAAFAMIRLAEAGVPFPIAPVLAAGASVLVGLVAGVPAVRVRGMNLAIATLAAAVAVEELFLKWDVFAGGLGGSRVPPPSLFGIDLGVSAAGADFPRRAFGVLAVVTVTLVAVAVTNMRRSRTGLRWLSVRANERAAASTGVDVRATKLGAFAASSFVAGLGGCMFAYGHQDISADSFVVFNSLALLATTYLGGIASIAGALLAGVLADGGLLSVARGGEGSELQFAIQGLVLIAVAALYPEGVTGAVYALGRRLRRNGSAAEPVEADVHDAAAAGGDRPEGR